MEKNLALKEHKGGYKALKNSTQKITLNLYMSHTKRPDPSNPTN